MERYKVNYPLCVFPSLESLIVGVSDKNRGMKKMHSIYTYDTVFLTERKTKLQETVTE